MTKRYTKYDSQRLGRSLWQFVVESARSWNSDNCLLWTHGTNEHGYGLVRDPQGKLQKVHRVAYWAKHGNWPEPFGLHSCDVPACFNPLHIVPGDQSKNMGDCAARLRSNHGERNAMHKLSEENVREIRALYLTGRSQKVIAALFGVSPITVGDILKRGAWEHVA